VALATVAVMSVDGALERAAAQEAWSTNRGVALGLSLHGDWLGAKKEGANPDPEQLFIDENGGGGTFWIGYTFTPSVQLRLAAGGAQHDTSDEATLYHNVLGLELHVRFLPEARFRPVLFAGLGGTSLTISTDEYDADADGGMATIGGGVLLHASSHFIVESSVRAEFINWDSVTLRREVAPGTFVELVDPVGEDEGGSVRFDLGVGWEF
jgi:hypothetical protein